MKKTVVITGAGSGIGRELSWYFGKHGWDICIVDIISTAARETAHQLTSLGDSLRVQVIAADIRDETAMKNVFNSCLKRFGRLDALINNAGITDKEHHRLLDLPRDVWEKILSINVTGTFVALTTFAKLVANDSGGNIVNISSLLGQPDQARSGDTPYGVSKAAVEALTRYAAAELSNFGINVNSVYPAAMVDTNFFDYLSPEERAALEPPSILNEAVYFLSNLRPGELTGISVNAKTWRKDPILLAIGEKYIIHDQNP